ncbi:MAG: hypothetical protein ACFFD4_36120, partial [Candidatus Odinarchaeota archaeon]
MSKNIGFISTRFKGTDGVSLESAKWAQVLWDYRHVSYWFAGQLDRAADISMEVEEAFFDHDEIRWINHSVFGQRTRTQDVAESIHRLRCFLKPKLYEFIDRFNLDILIPQNCLTIPMNIPLGLAMTEGPPRTSIPELHRPALHALEARRELVAAPGMGAGVA